MPASKPLQSNKLIPHRRKFRSQTSDNMDRWKAEQGRGREKRKIRREKSRRERVRRKKMEMREKVGKSRFTVFFQWFVAPEGRKVRSLERRVRSQLARGEMKNCTPLWREAHFEAKMYKTHHVRTTFGSWDVEKVHAVVARSTFPSRNAQNTLGADLEMSKKCAPLWREAHFEVKMYKTHQLRTTFGSWDVAKVHAAVARSTFPSQNVQSTPCTDHFWRFRCRFAWQAHGIVHLVKSDQNVRVLWHFQEWWQAWDIWRGSAKMHFRGRRSTKDMFMRDVRRSGRWFPERGCILEYQMCRFAKMILRDRCSTSYDLASIFRGRRSTLDRWTGKIAKRIGTSLSALHSTFHFWRRSRRILCFWCLALRKMRTPRRIALFRMLSSSKNEDVSQNCSVLDVLMFKHYGSLAEFLRFWSCR